MDRREVEVLGVIKNLVVRLNMYPDVSIPIDVIFINIPNSWVMLLLRKFVAHLGGPLQMDLSYATIPMQDDTLVRLDRESFRR